MIKGLTEGKTRGNMKDYNESSSPSEGPPSPTIDFTGPKITVTTKWCHDYIESSQLHKLPNGSEEIYSEVIRLRDEGVRKALIDLGWTPPDSNQ